MSATAPVLPASAAEEQGRPFDVVLMAFACEPGRGSEPGVGYAFAAAGARLAREDGRRVVLVTRPHRVREIREALGADAQHLEILPVALPGSVVRLTGRRRVRVAYLLWQALAVRRVQRLLRESAQPAVVHHVTFATEALPTFEGALRPRAAVVVGPAGSTAIAGTGMRLALRAALRAAASRSVLDSADVLIATNDHVGRSWAGARRHVEVEPNIVVEPRGADRGPAQWDAASAGLLVPRKRTEVAIRAFARSSSTGRMLVIGDGEERRMLEAVAGDEGVRDRVDFVGGVPREEALALLSRCRVLLHASRQEGAGWVVGEAQAVGTWPIVFAGGGADGTVRAAGVGTVVEDDSAEAMATALEQALERDRPEPSDRWSADRLPAIMRSWYVTALVRPAR